MCHGGNLDTGKLHSSSIVCYDSKCVIDYMC